MLIRIRPVFLPGHSKPIHGMWSISQFGLYVLWGTCRRPLIILIWSLILILILILILRWWLNGIRVFLHLHLIFRRIENVLLTVKNLLFLRVVLRCLIRSILTQDLLLEFILLTLVILPINKRIAFLKAWHYPRSRLVKWIVFLKTLVSDFLSYG